MEFRKDAEAINASEEAEVLLEDENGGKVGQEKLWGVRYPTGEENEEERVRRMAEELGLSEITARLLYVRGYRTREEAEAFLRNDDGILHDPFLMKDTDLAVARIRRAIDHGEKIVIYGDYDVDGVTSVSMLYLFLRSKGADVGY